MIKTTVQWDDGSTTSYRSQAQAQREIQKYLNSATVSSNTSVKMMQFGTRYCIISDYGYSVSNWRSLSTRL